MPAPFPKKFAFNATIYGIILRIRQKLASHRGDAHPTFAGLPLLSKHQHLRLSVKQSLLILKKLRSAWQEIQPGSSIKEQAVRLLRVHNLRAADALQLAAAIHASEHKPASLDLVILDSRLSDAAQREGFNVLP
jgi:hypothetical protein